MEVKVPEKSLKIHRVEMYLHDLLERIKELRLLHDQVLQNSVEIINEIDEVSLTLILAQDSSSENEGRIKRLIQKFETTREKDSRKEPKNVENALDIQQVLIFFEKLNESHVLTESLQLFRQAKESFEKVDVFFGTSAILGSSCDQSKQLKLKNINYKKLCISDSIRNKIDKFNQKQIDSKPTTSKKSCNPNTDVVELVKEHRGEINDQIMDTMDSSSHYASCCSSLISLERLKLNEDNSKMSVSKCSNSLTGYEGDNDDSEFDFLAAQKKISPN